MRLRLLVVLSVCSLVLSACMPTVISTEHDHVLLLETDGRVEVLADDDPLYEQFEHEVLGSVYISELMTIYAHSMETFIATNAETRYAQTVANKPIIWLNSAELGIARNVDAWYGETRVPIELGMGLGLNDVEDMSSAKLAMPSIIGDALLTLMDVTPPQDAAPIPDDAVGAEDQAFWQGFGAALDATYAWRDPTVRGQAMLAPGGGEQLLARYDGVPGNAMAQRNTANEAPMADELATPGVVGTFFYRLLSETGTYYPQRYMLWFANYDAQETSYGKVMLAMSQLPGGTPSMTDFMRVYAETFPAERDDILRLADEVFGEGAALLVSG